MIVDRRSHGVSLAVAALVVFATACGRKDKDEEGGGDAEVPAVVSARVITVTTQPFTETVGAIGNVVARSGRLATLSAPSGARVLRVLVSQGSAVSRGQPLVVLDPAPFQAAEQSAAAAATAAEQNFARTQRLANEGIAPRKDVEQATADLARARSDLVAARRDAQLATLRSPIAGVVTRLNASIGAAADPAQPLVEVADPSEPDIVLGATPTDAARMRPGAKVTLSAGQSASGEPLGIGEVVDVGGMVDSSTRTVSVRVRAATTRRPVRIGETVFGQVAVAMNPRAVVVPSEALVPEGDGFKVFVVDAAGVAHARNVTVGGRSDTQAEIRKGLAAGERVVTYGAYGVEDSARVVPLGQSPATAAPAAPAATGKP